LPPLHTTSNHLPTTYGGIYTQGLVVGADAASQRIIVLFSEVGGDEGKEIALKPENIKA
jgi:hypothetical protein